MKMTRNRKPGMGDRYGIAHELQGAPPPPKEWDGHFTLLEKNRLAQVKLETSPPAWAKPGQESAFLKKDPIKGGKPKVDPTDRLIADILASKPRRLMK